MRRLLVAILLVSAAAIGYELLLMRVLSIVQWHHFAYMIISLALLGYGASGSFVAVFRTALEPRFESAFVACTLMFAVTMVGSFILGQRVPFNALEIVWDPFQFVNLAVLYGVFFVPFFFAACCIGLAFTCRPALIGRIYFADLVGAGLGAIGVIAAVNWLSLHNALLVLCTLALAACVLTATSTRIRGPIWLMVAVALTYFAFGHPQQWLELRLSAYKGLSQALQTVGARVVAIRSGPLGLLTVVESDQVPFRHAPGLSFNTEHLPPRQLGVFIDGDSLNVITELKQATDLSGLGYLDDVSAALPFRLLGSPRVLVLGAGGGSDVLLALRNGASHVDAVEVNPQMSALVRDSFADFAGHVYEDRRVTLHTADARSYLARHDERYDLVLFGTADSLAASGAGTQALNESYLYTREALRNALERTMPGGLLSFTRWLQLPPRDSLKLVATAISVLRDLGVQDPGSRIAVIRSWNTSTIIVKNGRLSPGETARIREFARSHSFDVSWYPGMQRSEANRFNLLDAPFLHDGIVALLGDDADAFIDRYKFDITPATDDRPYFQHVFKWRSLPELYALRHRGGAGLLEWSYLVLIGTLLQAAAAGALLILLPLFGSRHRQALGRDRRRAAIYFFLLGLAFLFIEMAFIQKFILFLGHPLYAIAVVLAAFLVFAGVGSAASAQVDRWARARARSAIAVAVTGIACITLVYAGALPTLFARAIALGDPARIVISVVLIAPLAFFMGMPFPLGLTRVASRAADFVPWAWGINGFASVLSTALATLLAIELGFTAVLLAALALYVLAATLGIDSLRTSSQAGTAV